MSARDSGLQIVCSGIIGDLTTKEIIWFSVFDFFLGMWLRAGDVVGVVPGGGCGQWVPFALLTPPITPSFTICIASRPAQRPFRNRISSLCCQFWSTIASVYTTAGVWGGEGQQRGVENNCLDLKKKCPIIYGSTQDSAGLCGETCKYFFSGIKTAVAKKNIMMGCLWWVLSCVGVSLTEALPHQNKKPVKNTNDFDGLSLYMAVCACWLSYKIPNVCLLWCRAVKFDNMDQSEKKINFTELPKKPVVWEIYGNFFA